MRIRQFRYGRDNLGYVLWAADEALVVDGGAVQAVARFLDTEGINRCRLTNTHGHADHTCGNRDLAGRCVVIDHGGLADDGEIVIGGEPVRVLRTPGHTADSVCFLAGDILLTGDTLFNGTVGNCFSGDLRAFFASIRRLMALPPATRMYAGHDYVHDSMAFARRLEPDNRAIDAFLSRYNAGHVVSTMADELAVNPFLRFDAPSIRAFLEKKGLPHGTAWERWHSLMGIE